MTEEQLSPQGTEREEARTRSRWTDRLPTIVVFAIVFGTLLYFYRPDLLFSLTTAAGGDTGAHHYPAQQLMEQFLPRFQITGWAQGWYAGMPMLTFYFPLSFLLIAGFNLLLPYTLAFKLVTVLGVFLLPVAAYIFGRLFRLPRPFPQMAAALTPAFLLMESYSIYGGNILSTLAGEFSYSLSFSLVFIFLGTLHRGMERSRADLLFVGNVLILSALVLSHLVPVIGLIVITPSLLLLHPNLRAVGYTAGVFILGFFTTAFWGLPFLDKLPWTAHMAWTQLDSISDLLPPDVRIQAAVGLVGMAYALAKKDRRTIPLAWITVSMVVLFYLLPDGRVWNARLLPFFYFSWVLWAAYAAAWLTRPFSMVARDLLNLGPGAAGRVYAPAVALATSVTVILVSTTASGWIEWNYSGYEGKASWEQYREINEFIAELPPGRVMVEHADEIDRYGTPRAFELLPYWSDHPTMEGTLMEAAFTAPYHFINQAELSVQPSHAIVGVDYPSRNTGRGLTHLQFMNIPYLITASPEVTSEVQADPRTDLLTSIDGFSIFRVAGSTGYVQTMENQAVRLSTTDWRTPIVEWYKQESALDVPVIWDRGEPALEDLPEITAEQAGAPPALPTFPEGQVISENLEEEKLTFQTTAIGQPHWIKMSYFPNWEAEGAEGPFVASPSFMMVIPTEREVTLTYGATASNVAGQIMTGGGFIVLAAIALISRRRKRQSGTSPGPGPGEAPPEPDETPPTS